MFVKNLAVAELLDQYAPVLGERHRTVLEYYYDQDLSLGEIAELLGISRQGVRESIKRAEDELNALESGLHLARRAWQIEQAAERVRALVGADPALSHAVEELITAAQTVPEENET